MSDEELDEFKEQISEETVAELIDMLVQKRIEVATSEDVPLVENLKIRELKRQINSKFLENSNGPNTSKSSGVSKVSNIVSY
jgi:thioredoxin-like negative regulator of GroEL